MTRKRTSLQTEASVTDHGTGGAGAKAQFQTTDWAASAPIRVFDCHAHIFPDRIAAATVELLGAEAKIRPCYNGTRGGLLASMAEAGIGGALNCPIATRPDQVDSINRWAVAQNHWPVLSLGAIHPDSPAPATILQSLKNAGIRGVKLHPEYQRFRLDDSRLDAIWEACRALDVVVMLHAGGDIAFDPPFRSDPESIATLVERMPGLRLIAAHFGSWQMWERVAKCLSNKPVFMDLSFTFGLLDDDAIVSMSRAHGTQRIMFGTDAPWRPQREELLHFLRLPFTKSEQQRILWQNAADLFDLPQRDGHAGTAAVSGTTP